MFQSRVLAREARKIAVVHAPIEGIGTGRRAKNPGTSTNQGYWNWKGKSMLRVSIKDK